MAYAVWNFILAVATLVYTASQPLVALLLATPKTWEEKLLRLRGLRLYWRTSTLFIVAFAFVALMTIVVSDGPPTEPFAGQINDDADSGESEPTTDDAEIREVVKQSQMLEFLEFYGDPRNVNSHDLQKYWLPGSEAAKDIQICLQRLNRQKRHYGPGSKLLDFDFRYVRIFNDRAEVGTREHWFLPLIHADGTPVRSRLPDQGPYSIDYTLRKVKSRWFLESTTTPYVHKQKK